MIEEIRLLNLSLSEPGERPSKIKGTASVSLDGIRLFDLRIVNPDDGGPFVRFPARKYFHDDGTFEYRAYIKLADALKKKVDELILSEYRSQLALRKAKLEKED